MLRSVLTVALLVCVTSAATGDDPFGGRFGGQLEIRSSSSGYSISRSSVNGVTTTKATENGKTVKIVEDPETGIKVESTKTYDRSNHSELKESNPAIYRYIDSSPQGMGPQKINVKVELTQVYEAQNVDDLKEKHPEAYKLYEKYSKGPRAIRLDVRGFEGFDGAVPFKIEVKPGIKIEKEKKTDPKEADSAPNKESKPEPKPERGIET